MHSRRRMLALIAASGAFGPGCLSLGSSEEPVPSAEIVGAPEPVLPEFDPLDAPPLPAADEEPVVSARVRNDGQTGKVHVSFTPLEEGEDGTYTGVTARVAEIELDAGEARSVEFEDVPTSEYDRYRIEAKPNTITVFVENEGDPGDVEVSIVGRDTDRTHDSFVLELESGEQREVTRGGVYVQPGPDRLEATATPL